ncbi:hypothetical protein DMQ72_11305 [Klebsiella quasipneumoniae]|uniref:YjeJ family protein n=1 Tax=Klebsiella quasipneumoniae TaxID=1463165 RepID=UPI000D74D0F3|nr:YjeJ family protein [Klebsiella quasipneumoniae]PXH97140.1 hypothetical protein DMQ72_11305 [Klebsiella quasipneumoniae]
MIVKGINTAPIKQGDHLFLMSFKVKDANDSDRLFYMQITTLVDFLTILRNRVLRVSERILANGEIYKKKAQVDIESLASNIPEITPAEVMQPNPGNLVTSIAPKFKDDTFSLIVILQNEKVLTLEINDTQVEFIIMAIQKAIETIDDKDTMLIISSLVDFLLIYSVDLSNLQYLNYKEIKHEIWKQHLFSDYLEVIYCFETEKGKEILAGTIIKTNAQPESQEIESIVKRIAHLTPMLKALLETYPLYQTFYQRIPALPAQILTKEDCLNSLYNFCLKTQDTLQR